MTALLRTHRLYILFLVCYFLCTTFFLFAFLPDWGNDDPYITYRYAENLYAGRGFVYNVDERILSTTSPLFALILAGARMLTANLPRVANLIGAASLAAGALFLWDIARQWHEPRAGWVALALYPTFELLVRTLGSETPLYLALCLAAFAFYLRQKYTLTALLLAFAFLTRGDAAVLGGVLAVDWIRQHWPRTGAEVRGVVRALPWRAIAVGAVILLGWGLFAGPYFGSPLPVTLAAKRAQGLMLISEKFAPGFWASMRPYARHVYFWGEVMLMGGGLLAALRRKVWWGLVGWAGLYFLAYTLLGVTRYFWYYAPLVPAMVGMVGLGWAMLQRLPVRSRAGGRWLSGGAYLLLGWLAVAQGMTLVQLPQNPDERLVAYRMVGEWLAENSLPKARIGTLEVGVIGYYAMPRTMVDFAGLIQPEVADLFAPEVTYQDTAQWAIAAYQPNLLVLHDGWFPLLEQGFVAGCTLAQHFPSAETGYSVGLSVYKCEYP